MNPVHVSRILAGMLAYKLRAASSPHLRWYVGRDKQTIHAGAGHRGPVIQALHVVANDCSCHKFPNTNTACKCASVPQMQEVAEHSDSHKTARSRVRFPLGASSAAVCASELEARKSAQVPGTVGAKAEVGVTGTVCQKGCISSPLSRLRSGIRQFLKTAF